MRVPGTAWELLAALFLPWGPSLRWDAAAVWSWNLLGVSGLGMVCGRGSARVAGGCGLRTWELGAADLGLVRGARLPGHPCCKCPPREHVAPSWSRAGAGVSGESYEAPWTFVHGSSEAWGPRQDVRGVPSALPGSPGSLSGHMGCVGISVCGGPKRRRHTGLGLGGSLFA